MFTKLLCQKKLEFICSKLGLYIYAPAWGGSVMESIRVNKLYGYLVFVFKVIIYIYNVRGSRQCDYRASSSILFSCKP
jgi:hypothetical protein